MGQHGRADRVRRRTMLSGGWVCSFSGYCYQCGEHTPSVECPGEETQSFLLFYQCCKMQVRNKEKRGKGGGGECEGPLVRSGMPASRMRPSSLFPGDVEEKAHPKCQPVLKPVRIQKIMPLYKKDIFKKQQNRPKLENLKGRRKCV